MDRVKLAGNGLKCDAQGCTYSNQEVQMDDMEKWIGSPCPACGASLLTTEDFTAILILRLAVEMTNSILGSIEDGDNIQAFTVKMNGTGQVIIEPRQEPEERKVFDGVV